MTVNSKQRPARYRLGAELQNIWDTCLVMTGADEPDQVCIRAGGMLSIWQLSKSLDVCYRMPCEPSSLPRGEEKRAQGRRLGKLLRRICRGEGWRRGPGESPIHVIHRPLEGVLDQKRRESSKELSSILTFASTAREVPFVDGYSHVQPQLFGMVLILKHWLTVSGDSESVCNERSQFHCLTGFLHLRNH
jgi:hypothetical protein